MMCYVCRFLSAVRCVACIMMTMFVVSSGPAIAGMFQRTFGSCVALTEDVDHMYTGTCLSDNASVPDAWGKNAGCRYQ